MSKIASHIHTHTPVYMMKEEVAKEMRPISLWGPSDQQ